MKVVLYAIGSIVLLIASYIGYLAATYIDESIIIGTAYGFEIGSSKKQSFDDVKDSLNQFPQLVIYYSYGRKAGDYEIVLPKDNDYSKIEQQDRWILLLDGDGEFFNVIKLTFRENKLIEINRHRKYFEMP